MIKLHKLATEKYEPAIAAVQQFDVGAGPVRTGQVGIQHIF